MNRIKQILSSKLFRLLFSVVLIYLAFKKINLGELREGLLSVPGWFVVFMVVYSFVGVMIGAVRWAYLLLDKPNLGDFGTLIKANYIGGFYSLFLSSSVGGDVVKWLPLIKKYPHLSKARIASTVLIDRILGVSGLAVVAFIAVFVGRLVGVVFPDYLFWFFTALFAGLVIFYILVFTVNFEELLSKIPFSKRFLQVVDVLKNGNKKRLVLGLGISLLGQPHWIASTWFISNIVGAGMSLASIFVFVPVVNLILTLPISVAGFGAREQLYLLFFGQLGLASERILLVSTFGGIMGVLSSLLGGLLLLI
ncbi:MAG: lysylphosphatidylglycerol synthase transmembrane domain-containing protein [Patescibacteria group bacterium]|jgi:uncharacterized membrane protein YbhN (UPF0104 family)